jgi:hypothetical protein
MAPRQPAGGPAAGPHFRHGQRTCPCATPCASTGAATLALRLSDKSLQMLETAQRGHPRRRHPPPHPRGPTARTIALQEYAAPPDKRLRPLRGPRPRPGAHRAARARQYRLDGEECIVFTIGGRHQRRARRRSHRIRLPRPENGSPRRVFRGEQLFSSAIFSLTQSIRPVRLISSRATASAPRLEFDRRTGYSRIAARLRDENLDVELLNLGEIQSVPALRLDGHRRPRPRIRRPSKSPWSATTSTARAACCCCSTPAPNRSRTPPAEWGVLLGDDVVVDESRTLSGRELHITTYPAHPITAPSARPGQRLLPAPLHPLPPLHRRRRQAARCPSWPLAPRRAGPNSIPTTPPHFDPQVDIPGPVPVAVAIERGPVPGVHVQIRPTRLVVVGDSDFASNGGLMGANADFFLNSVNWLLDRDELLALSPKTFEELGWSWTPRSCAPVLGRGRRPARLVAAARPGVAWKRRR